MILFRYEKNEQYTIPGSVEVYANNAPVGILTTIVGDKDNLNWYPDSRVRNVRFQFRNEDTFLSVVAELKRYKNEHGYKYLTIWPYNNGYVSQLSEELLKKAGFKHFEDQPQACMSLE